MEFLLKLGKCWSQELLVKRLNLINRLIFFIYGIKFSVAMNSTIILLKNTAKGCVGFFLFNFF